MNGYEHFVFTRLGVGITNPKWYEYRLPLFRATAFSSLMAQTEKRFSWIIAIDHEIPSDALRELEEMRREFPCIQLITRDETREAPNPLHVLPSDRPCLTSRIDDDDAIHIDMYRQVYALADQADCDTMFTFPAGLELDLRGRQYTPHGYPSYAMAAHLLTRDARKTNILTESHAKLTEFAQARALRHFLLSEIYPAWIYVRHVQVDSNLRKSKALMPFSDNALDQMCREFGMAKNTLDQVMATQHLWGRPSSAHHLGGVSYMRAKSDLLTAIRQAPANEKPQLLARYREMKFNIYPTCEECGAEQTQDEIERHGKVCAKCAEQRALA